MVLSISKEKKFSVIFLLLFLLPFYLRAQYRNKERYGARDLYYTLAITPGFVQSPSIPGKLDISFPYSTQDMSGNITQSRFNSIYQIDYKGELLYNRACVSFEMGNYRYFFNLKIGGAVNAPNFSASLGMNFYLNFLPETWKCWSIKPSFGIGRSQLARIGHALLGSIDNDKKIINTLGYTFYPATLGTKTLDVYYFQDSYFLLPAVSIGKNNYERLFYFDINFAYYFPFQLRNGIQLNQSQQGNLKTVWLDGSQSISSSFNGAPISNAPSIYSGWYFGITLGINLSDEIVNKYRVWKPGETKIKDYSRVCHCESKHRHVKRSKAKKKQTPPEKGDNVKGW